MRRLLSFITYFLPKTPYTMVYMLQQVEYHPKHFSEWLQRYPDFRHVMKRQKLVVTKKAAFLLLVAYGVWVVGIGAGLYLLLTQKYFWGAALIFLTPALVVFSLYLVCSMGFVFLHAARQKVLKRAGAKMRRHTGTKIAVLGSFGKTTFKEILATVLSEGKQVAMTPGNKNVAISHARWIESRLSGSEEILIMEYGEFRPGDITEIAKLTNPDMAVITGVAPNHLENYASYDDLKADLASIQLFVEAKNLYTDELTGKALGLQPGQFSSFDNKDVLGWKISKISSDIDGTSFELHKGKSGLKLESRLIGEHLVLPLALAAAIAQNLGLSKTQIEAGVAKTLPFEHRMQPYMLNGATVIDDTYNGNIEGMRAGLDLLKSIKAKRKIYVTPGLVEQGTETERVHVDLGKYIAQANPAEVVLMQNSVEPYIKSSLIASGYKGIIRIVDDPLAYYENLQYHVAEGDLVLMQNDWTDNYN